MVYAEFLVPVIGRTLELLALDALDHYGILGQDGRVYLSVPYDSGVVSDSVSILSRLASVRQQSAFPCVERSWLQSLLRGRSITRLVIELASGELMVLALNQWLTEAAARSLADSIEGFIWERQSGMPRRRGGYGHPYGMPIANAIPAIPGGMAITARPVAVWPTKF